MFGADITISFDNQGSCIEYISQAIPSPIRMHRYEEVSDVWDVVTHTLTSTAYSVMSPYFTGLHVEQYIKVLLKAEELMHIHILVSSCIQNELMPTILENNF